MPNRSHYRIATRMKEHDDMINSFKKNNNKQYLSHKELSGSKFWHSHIIDYNVLIKDESIAVD